MAVKKRVYQVAERIRELVAKALARTADPRFYFVTITSVVVTPDLRIAKVYWVVTVLDANKRDERIEEVQTAFDSAAGLFRREVGKELGLRFVPEMKFFYDDTLDTVEQVERVLAKARMGSQPEEESDAEQEEEEQKR